MPIHVISQALEQCTTVYVLMQTVDATGVASRPSSPPLRKRVLYILTATAAHDIDRRTMADPGGDNAWRRSASRNSIDGEESAAGDDTSIRSTGSKRRATCVNLSVPQPSYAYGAPPDESTRNDKIHARHGRSGSAASAASVSGGASANGEERSQLPASERYALLRAQRRSAAALTAEASERQLQARQQRQGRAARADPPRPPSPRRRNESPLRPHDPPIEEEEEEEEETRHSQQGTPVRSLPSMRDSNRSFFPRGGPSTASSGLLVAAQKRGNPLSSPRPPGPGSLTGSGTASYDYADESAMARDLMNHMTPSASRGSSPPSAPVPAPDPQRRKRRAAPDPVFQPTGEPSSDPEPENVALTADDRQAIEEAARRGKDAHAAQHPPTRGQSKRRPRRNEDDAPFRPEPEGASSDGGVSDGPKRTNRRHLRTLSQSRAGQEDARIWATKRRQVAAKGPQLNGGFHPPETVIEDEDEADSAEVEDLTASDSRDLIKIEHPSPLLRVNWTFFRTRAGAAVLVGLLMALLAIVYPFALPHQGIFVPPSTPPRDVSALAARLHKLEQAVGSLSSAQGSQLIALKTEFGRTRAELVDRLSRVELHTKEGQKTVDSLETQAAELRKEIARLTSQLGDKERHLQSELTALSRHLHSVDKSNTATSGAASELKQRIALVETTLRQTSSNLAQLQKARSESQVQHTALADRLDRLEKSLPAQMAVKRNSHSGKLEVDPTFWNELRKHVSSDGDEEQLRRQAKEDTLALLRDPATLGDTQLVSRSDFAALVRGELQVLQAQLEAKFTERLTEAQGDMWERLRKTAKTYTDAGSLDRTSARFIDRLLRPGAGAVGESADVPLEGGSNAVLALIDAALERYSADKLARPDYALYTIGGRVVPSLTSPSYSPSQPGWLSSAVRAISPIPMGAGSVPPRAPVVALHPDTTPGMCWAFAGSEGQLGVALFKSIVVTDITVEHVPRSLVSDARAAPREVHAWGLMSTQEDKDTFRTYLRERANLPDEEPMPSPPEDDYLYLGTMHYDASPHTRAIQTFPVPPAIKALRIPTSVLRFRFVGNHGSQEFTCIYRVRVHGDE